MKFSTALVSGALLALLQTPAYAAGDTELFRSWTSETREYLQLADSDDRQERREERGRSDERQDRRECRQEEGLVGQDKRECKQEEVRDSLRGDDQDSEDQ